MERALGSLVDESGFIGVGQVPSHLADSIDEGAHIVLGVTYGGVEGEHEGYAAFI